MPDKPRLIIHTGVESSAEEIETVRATFATHFDTDVSATIVRASEGDLPFTLNVVAQGLVGSAAYDLLKAGIKALLKNRNLRRRPNIVIREREATYFLSDEKAFIQTREITKEFGSIDDVFEYLKNQDQ